MQTRIKVRTETTREAVVGGIRGTLADPETFILGLPRTDGTLAVAGLTRPIPRKERAALAALLAPAGARHPWPETLPSSRLGQLPGNRPRVPYTRVEPALVVEVRVDSPMEHGAWRHTVVYVRARPELHPEDLR